MKKTIAIILLITLCMSLCACSLVPEAEVVVLPVEETSSEAEQAAAKNASEIDSADAEAAETLCGIMEDMYTNYHPGTAGSSLKLAAFTARMLDWYELRGSVGAISRAAAAFAAAHEDYAETDNSTEAASGFPETLKSSWNNAVEMSFPGGNSILDDCGYSPDASWSPDHTETFYSQLFSAFGFELPILADVYYSNMQKAAYPVEAVNEYAAMSALYTAGVISPDIQLNAFINDGDHLAIDLSSGFTDYLNSLDSTGEHYALCCVALTFLDLYSAEDITVTVEGKSLATNYGIYDFGITRSDV